MTTSTLRLRYCQSVDSQRMQVPEHLPRAALALQVPKERLHATPALRALSGRPGNAGPGTAPLLRSCATGIQWSSRGCRYQNTSTPLLGYWHTEDSRKYRIENTTSTLPLRYRHSVDGQKTQVQE